MASDLRFEKPGALQVTYRRPREGPSSFLIWMPNWSGIALTRKELLKKVNWSKSTQTGASLRTWLDTIEAQAAPTSEPETVNPSSWGPEAFEVIVTDDAEPNDNTKTVI